MADTTFEFRTAVGGFHKGDVTGYIEYMTAQHQAALREYEEKINFLQEENRSLRQQMSLLMMATPIAPEASAPAPVAPQEEPAPAAPVPEAAPVSSQSNDDLMTLELLAYRRAEAVERDAAQRARSLYQQMGNLCDSAMDEFHTADMAAKQTIELIIAQAKTLEQSYMILSQALSASQAKLAAINAELCADAED